MNKRAANIQTLVRLDELEAQITGITEAQSLTIDDVRQTIHRIAEQIAAVADAIPAIAQHLEEIALWVAKVTGQEDPKGFQKPLAYISHIKNRIES